MSQRSRPSYKTGSKRYKSSKPARRARPAWILPALIAAGVLLVIGVGATAYSINLENHDSFCASCHTQPETQFVDQSQAPQPVTLAAFHTTKNTRCIDCHSGSGAFGRAVGLMQGSQDLFSFLSGRYHNPAITTNPIGDNSCTKCHGNIADTQDFNNHFHFFLARWQGADPNAAHCVDCHAGHTQGTADQGFMTQTTVEAICQRCHEALGGGG